MRTAESLGGGGPPRASHVGRMTQEGESFATAEKMRREEGGGGGGASLLYSFHMKLNDFSVSLFVFTRFSLCHVDIAVL